MPVYDEILNTIYHPRNTTTLENIIVIVSKHSEGIAKAFYNEMLINPHAANYLNHDDVKQRLVASMANWLVSAFLCRVDKQSIEEYKQYQSHIGHIHGRIGIPVRLVNYAMFLIKQSVSRLLLESDLPRTELGEALVLSNQILDCALQIINDSYEIQLISNEKESQSFQIQFSSQHLAFDCERLRTSLSDWMRELLLTIQQNNFEILNTANIRQSNFGLWVTHKANLFLANSQEFKDLVHLLNEMDSTLQKLIRVIQQAEEKQLYLKTLNNLVSQANWVLGEIAKGMIDQEHHRDNLTRLFNRRYLDTVMRHETVSSLRKNMTFGIIILDIDFFKKINDTYGHDGGDCVLSQLAEILIESVRAGDFIFRLGGEEFLIVIADVKPNIIYNIAESIRTNVSNKEFLLTDNRTLKVTVSIGTAIHDGHPDFNRTIKLADTALYQAKQNGRNKVVSISQYAKAS